MLFRLMFCKAEERLKGACAVVYIKGCVRVGLVARRGSLALSQVGATAGWTLPAKGAAQGQDDRCVLTTTLRPARKGKGVTLHAKTTHSHTHTHPFIHVLVDSQTFEVHLGHSRKGEDRRHLCLQSRMQSSGRDGRWKEKQRSVVRAQLHPKRSWAHGGECQRRAE